MVRWSVEQVLRLAPDASSLAAARRLTAPSPWRDVGAGVDAVWGRCAGSGREPYQTVVDLAGPAYRCSCPSRKLPCKHALALLLRWSGGQLPDRAEPAEFAAAWLEQRRTSAAPPGSTDTPRSATAAKQPGAKTADPAAAAARARQRTERVAAGFAELDRWMCDQVREGLAGAGRLGYADLDRMAVRLVDAQAQPVAAAVRSLAAVRARPHWPDRLLAELALLRLLGAAHARLEELPAGLAATVRARAGYQVAREDVLATAPVFDLWHVLSQEDSEDDRVSTRRIWLAGARTGRFALLLSFAVLDRPFDLAMSPGTAFEGGVHFYPGDPPLRALPAPAHRPVELPDAPEPAGVTVASALEVWSAVLCTDPWTTSWPVLLDAVLPLRADEQTFLVDATGASPPLRADGLSYGELLAVSGGRPIRVFGELSPDSFRARAVVGADD